MRRLLIGGVAAAALLGAGAVGLNALGTEEATRTAPGTVLAGLPAGGLDDDGLRDLLGAHQPPATVTVTLGVVTARVTGAELVPDVDVEATVRKALHESGDTGRWFGLRSSRGSAVSLVLDEDEAARDALVARLVKTAKRAESHGDLVYRGGVLTTRPPTDGQQTSEQQVREVLTDYPGTLPFARAVTIPVEVEAGHVSVTQLEELADRARILLQPGLTFTAGERSRAVPRSELGPQLTVDDDSGLQDGTIDLRLRPSGVDDLIEPIADDLSVDPVEPTVRAPVPSPMLETKGTATWKPVAASTSLVKGGKAGQVVTTAAVRTELNRLLGNPQAAAALSVTPTPGQPKTSDAQARAINSVLGTFTTRFQCCQSRVTNIKLIARTIDGTLIAPGQTFSLNGIVGPRTRAKGYVEAPFILDGELSTDVGGGVSQFATTALNAAFFAGQRLDRHQAHSFYISRYPAGREATVNFPGIDLAWTNTTGAGILVRTMTTDTSLTVTLYGANDRRQVTGVTGPRRPVPGRDFRITITRTVQLPGQAPRRDSFTTTYNKPPEDD